MAKKGTKTTTAKNKKAKTPKTSGRISAAERQELKEVNKMIKAAKASGTLSQSKPLLQLNKALKQHKNKRLSEKDYKEQKNRIQRLLSFGVDTVLDLLKERKNRAKERKSARTGIKDLEKKTQEIFEKIRNISPYISHQAKEIGELMEQLSDKKQLKHMTTEEVKSAKEKIKDYIENFEVHKEEIERGMSNYARLWGLKEEDLKNPAIIDIINEIEDLSDEEDWYEMTMERSAEEAILKAQEGSEEDIFEEYEKLKKDIEANAGEPDEDFYSLNGGGFFKP